MNSYILVQFVWKLVGKKTYDTLLAKFLLDTTKVFCASTNFVVSAALHQIASFPTLSSTTVIFPH